MRPATIGGPDRFCRENLPGPILFDPTGQKTPAIPARSCQRQSKVLLSVDNRIAAELLAGAVLTLETGPDGIELIDGRLDQGRIIRQDARLEVPGAGALHADSGTGQIGRADVRRLQIEDDDLEMDTRTQRPLQSGEQHRIAVEILPEIRPRLLGMDQPHLPALLDQVRDQPQERPLVNIQILDVGRPDPQRAPHLRHPRNHLPEMGFVCDVLRHIKSKDDNICILRHLQAAMIAVGVGECEDGMSI